MAGDAPRSGSRLAFSPTNPAPSDRTMAASRSHCSDRLRQVRGDAQLAVARARGSAPGGGEHHDQGGTRSALLQGMAPARSRPCRASPRRSGRGRTRRLVAAAARTAASAASALSTTTGSKPQPSRSSPRTPPLVRLSSTTRIAPPRDRARDRAARASARRACEASDVKWKVLPAPDLALDPQPPPISSTRRDEIVRPRPVPPYLRVVDPSACAKASKMTAACPSGCPMPVSRTWKCELEPSSTPRASQTSTRTNTSPLLGELDRVAHQVDAGSGAAAARRRRRLCGTPRRDPVGQLQPLLVRAQRQRLDGVGHDVARARTRRCSSSQLPGLDLREVEDVVDDHQQRVGRGLRPSRGSRAARASSSVPSASCVMPDDRRSSACGSRG